MLWPCNRTAAQSPADMGILCPTKPSPKRLPPSSPGLRAELTEMSESAGLDLLAYYLDMARLEAIRLAMCNLFSVTTNLEALRAIVRDFKVAEDIGNFPPQPGVYPDYLAPIIRNNGAMRELTKVRWGLPSSSSAQFGLLARPFVLRYCRTMDHQPASKA